LTDPQPRPTVRQVPHYAHTLWSATPIVC